MFRSIFSIRSGVSLLLTVLADAAIIMLMQKAEGPLWVPYPFPLAFLAFSVALVIGGGAAEFIKKRNSVASGGKSVVRDGLRIGLNNHVSAPMIILGSMLCIILLILIYSLFSKFDVTDEGFYIYALSHPYSALNLFSDNIFGHIGGAFDNNIIIWRLFGFISLIFSAAFFGDSIYRLAVGSRCLTNGSGARLALGMAPCVGAIFFYAYGPPTFSYRAAGSITILLLFAFLIRALLAEGRLQRHGWSCAAALLAVLFVAARPPAAVAYPIAALPLVILALRQWGGKRVGGIIVLHAIYWLLLAIVVIFGIIGLSTFQAQLIRMTAVSEAGYDIPSLIRLHGQDILIALTQSFIMAAPLIGVAAASALPLGMIFGRRRLLFQSLLLPMASMLPLTQLWWYQHQWPVFESSLATFCGELAVLVCQGPTPALTGMPLIQIAWAQILCVLVGGLVGPRLGREGGGGQVNGWWGGGLIIAFLVLVTPVSSVLTNVGLLSHSILSFAPLVLAVVLSFGLFPVSHFAAPRVLVAVTLCLYMVLGGILALHNSAFFPHRVMGTLPEQTVRLVSPPSLAGLRVAPATASIFERMRAALLSGGYDSNKDVVVAAYNLPGLVVVAGGRSLGSPWILSGYDNIDAFNCRNIEADPVDLQQLGRVFFIINRPPSELLSSCLKRRGVDIAQARILDSFPTGDGRSLTISVVAVSATAAVNGAR
jgi:hypothetical protein